MVVIEEYTIRFLTFIEPSLNRFPPSYYVGGLLGVINTCIFYLRFGRGLLLFFPFLVIGAAASIVGLTIGKQLPASGPFIGEINVATTVITTWFALFVARSLRL
ncbi:MAG: hypothetical protein ACOX87_11950 [Chloroflexota bacterium]